MHDNDEYAPPPPPSPPRPFDGGTLLKGSTAGTTGARHQKSVKGDLVIVGTRSWLERHGVSIPPELEGHASSLEWQGKTVVFVAGGGSAKGILAVADSVRPEAREAVGELHRCVGENPGESSGFAGCVVGVFCFVGTRSNLAVYRVREYVRRVCRGGGQG